VTRRLAVADLGTVPYGAALERQRSLAEDRIAGRQADDLLLLLEHPPVVTLGRGARDSSLPIAPELLRRRGIEVFEIERGGDVTYHGPGQVVVYPIRKLPRFREVVPLVSALERATIAALATFGIVAATRPEHRGVYVGNDAIAAIGLAVRRMTSLHGVALNACGETDYDRLITPCGMPQFGITSIARTSGRTVSWTEARDALLAALANEFTVTFKRAAIRPRIGAAHPGGTSIKDTWTPST